MSLGLFKNVTNKMFRNHLFDIYIYMYKNDLALNNLQWLICHKTKPRIIVSYLKPYYCVQIIFIR